MSNASQKRTNRAPFFDELMSRQPASTIGWLATTPHSAPLDPAKPMMMLAACDGCGSSKKSPSSATFRISSCMS